MANTPTNYSDTNQLVFDKKTRKEWLKNIPATSELRNKDTDLIKDNNGNYVFASNTVEKAFEDHMFTQAFGTLPEFNDLTYLSREERRAFYNKYQGSADIYRAREYDKGKAGFWDYEENQVTVPFAPVVTPEGNINYNALAQQQRINEQATLEAEQTINAQNSQDDTPIVDKKQYEAEVKKLVKESEELFPSPEEIVSKQKDLSPFAKGQIAQSLATQRLYEKIDPLTGAAKGLSSTLAGDKSQDYQYLRAQYIRDNLKIPEQNNPYKDVSEEDFIRNLSKLSSTYNLLQHTQWLPDKDVNEVVHQLYTESIRDLNAGRVYKVEAALDKAFDNIVAKYQPKGFKGGDEFIHPRAQVFFENAAAGAVENLIDFFAVPVGALYGLGAMAFGENWSEQASILPNYAHDVAKAIAGDYATAYGDDLGAAAANSGYTVGTMAIDAALMAIPTTIVENRIAQSTKIVNEALKTAKIAKFNKIYGTLASLDYGLCEGTVDAIEARDELIKNASEKAALLPASQREAFMQNAINEANTAYGRILLEESLVVNVGTLLGLGFNGSLLSRTATQSLKPSIWSQTKSKNLAFTGKTLYDIGKLTLGELLEEYAQGMSSGINKARANYNIDNYVTALHYGLGTDYLTNTQLGFLQGLERFVPQAWVEMDPENLTKQVLLSTLFFRGLHLPGKGKSKYQIAADNNTTIGKIWDNIRKWTPVQTGLGQIIADAKEETYDIENRLENGFKALLNDDNLIATLQSQAALTDIGIQMQEAINNGNITSYQQLAAAYQVAQAVMLSDASKRSTRFGKNYFQILDKRANFNSLNDEDKVEVLKAWQQETQANQDLSEEDQIKFMSETAAQTIKLMRRADKLYDNLQKDTNITGQDIRPLIFAQLLYESVPESINNNWENFIISEDSNIRNREDLNQTAVDYLLNNYFGQANAQDRSKALTRRRNVENVSQEDWNNAWNAIMQELRINNLNVDNIVRSDINLSNWRKELYNQWKNMYDRVLKGEGVLPSDFNKKHKDVAEELSGNPNKKIRKFQKAVTQAESINELRAIINQERSINGDRKISRQYDIDDALRSITDTDTQNKIAELDRIERAKNSLQNLINQSDISEELKDNLDTQVEDIANNADSVNTLYDISNYSLPVSPEEYDTIAGKLQEIINNSKNLAGTAQTVNNSPVTEQKGDTQNPAPANLGPKRDVDTAPAVNTQPITKLTIEDAKSKILKANDIINNPSSNGFDNTQDANNAAARLIEEVKTKCPEGYRVVVGGNGVALVSVQPSNVVRGAFDIETGKPKEDATTPTFVESENIIEEEIPYEDIISVDTSLDIYPDNDVRSITKIAIGKYSEDGRPYTFAVRDEEVQDSDRAETSYTDKNGKVQTGITGPLEVISIEEFNRRRETNPKDYSLSLEELANYARPKFVSKNTNKEVEKIPITTVKTNRTEAQQQRLDNNITPARNEISAQFLPKEKEGYKAVEQGKEYTRLGDEAHRNIDSQLEEQGAFKYRNSGRLQIGDEIQFVVSEEPMPDGNREVVIWEITKPKDKQIPEDSKFKGMQVLSVLDQTNMSGDRLALINRIRKAYDEAGRPESFFYDKETFKIDNIINGVIPFVQTNPVEASSNATIESTNLKKGLIKNNGKWGMSFWNQKLGRMIHFPITFKQVVRNNNNITETISDSRVTNVEDIKHEYASQNSTREVMLVTITPTGYKAAHSVYVMRRDVENAVDKYIQAIQNGELGKALIKKMQPRLTDNNALTFFSDFFRFNRGISERVYFDRNHNRLELGYFNNGQYTTLLYAKGIGDNKYVTTEQDARVVTNDNDGKGFSFDEIAKEYLAALVQDETVGASVQINMEAITKDHSVVDALIEDGFLWAPNSINARFGMENTGFSASINNNNQTEPKKVKEKPEPKTAPVEKAPTIDSTPSTQPKQKVPKTVKNDHAMRVPRKKLKAEDALNITNPNPEVLQEEPTVNIENSVSATINYSSLNSEQKQHIQDKGFTQETFDSLTQLEKENVLNC